MRAVAALLMLLPCLQDDPADAWIRDLASDSIDVRANAARELIALGDRAVDALRKAVETGTPEVRRRAEAILTRLGKPAKAPAVPPGPDFTPVKFKPAAPRVLAARPKGLAPGTSASGDMALRGLEWLARHQARDGSWSDMGAQDDTATGTTALALLAFGAAGYTSSSKDESGFGDAVRKGLRFLIEGQDKEGCFGPRVQKLMYGHILATMAAAESVSADPTWEGLIQSTRHAVAFLLAAQNPGKGWRYSPGSGDNDTSVTGWAMRALVTARDAGFAVPDEAVNGGIAWLDDVTEWGGPYTAGYTHKGTGKVFIPGKNDHFNHHPTMTGAAVLSRLLAGGDRKSAAVAGGMTHLLADPPSAELEDLDYYYWHLASLAVFHVEGEKGDRWTRWNRELVSCLKKGQAADGPDAGSWSPVDRWSFEGGRVYTTAINAMTLLTSTLYARP